jgi:HEAT repeat protein
MQTDDTPEGRAAAARLLERVGGPGTASVLSTALGEGSFAVRGPSEAALLAIAGRTDGVAVARGIFPLAKSKSLPVRVAALRLLGATKHRDAKEVLEAALEDTDPLVSRAARIGMDRYEAD